MKSWILRIKGFSKDGERCYVITNAQPEFIQLLKEKGGMIKVKKIYAYCPSTKKYLEI